MYQFTKSLNKTMLFLDKLGFLILISSVIHHVKLALKVLKQTYATAVASMTSSVAFAMNAITMIVARNATGSRNGNYQKPRRDLLFSGQIYHE